MKLSIAAIALVSALALPAHANDASSFAPPGVSMGTSSPSLPTPPVCTAAQKLHWNGSSWVCNANTATISGIPVGTIIGGGFGYNVSCPRNYYSVIISETDVNDGRSSSYQWMCVRN